MGILTDDMKRLVAEIRLGYAATVSADGKPNLSPKGSLTVLSDNELGFADLASPRTVENLRHNPFIELNVVDPFVRREDRFKGRAAIVSDHDASALIAKTLGPEYPFERVVKIHGEEALVVFSPVYTLTQLSESDVKQFWLAWYGYRSVR